MLDFMHFFIIIIIFYLNFISPEYDTLLTKKANSVRLVFLNNW